MDDVKDKMKGFVKRVTSSSPSSNKFKGQGRVLGSSSSSASNSAIPSRPLPPTRPIVTVSNPQNPKPSAEFDPFDPQISPPDRSSSTPPLFDCPVCSSSFSSEEAVSSHVDLCLARDSETGSSGLTESISAFLTGQPREDSVEVVLKLFKNVVREPENDKFRRIRMGNPKIKEALGDVRGGVELLGSVGFRIGEEGGEVWATMEDPTEERLEVIKNAVLLLEKWKSGDSKAETKAESRVVEKTKKVDRQVRVFFSVPESVAANMDLPESFYNLSIEEIKREAELRKKRMADSQLLIPKSYKEKQAVAARKKYKLTVIRIQFPDGVVLQGIFLPSESTTMLYEFVSSALKQASLEFELLSPAAPRLRVIPRFPRPGDVRTSTLEEERLVPSALIKFKPIETDSIVFTGLTNELLEASEPLTSATTVLL